MKLPFCKVVARECLRVSGCVLGNHSWQPFLATKSERGLPALRLPLRLLRSGHGSRRAQAGQALAETALFSTLVIIMAFGLLSWIPFHRARTAATSAAYACAQFLSQSPNPDRAAWNAYTIAQQTLDADWSATLGVSYRVQVAPPNGTGEPGRCAVSYSVPVFFNGLLGLSNPGWSSEWFVSRSETWKAKW